MIKFAHLVMIPITGVGIKGGFRGQEWFKYRLEIFKKYTLNSLINQTNRVFFLWLTFRKEEENNPLIKELGEYFNQIKMPAIMTFESLMYWDDKFTFTPKNVIMNIGRTVRQSWRDKDLSFIKASFEVVFKNKNKSLLHRLERALWILRETKTFDDSNYICVTRIDSDDMFHKNVIDEIQQSLMGEIFEGALIYKKGYVYNLNVNKLAEWNPETNPPFHSIIFLGSKFFNPVEHKRFYKGFRSHEDIPKVFRTKQLSDGKYCVLVHKQQISTIWDHPFRGKIVEPDSAAGILKDFGVLSM